MSQYIKTEVAASIPFDNSTNGFQSDNVQGAIEETILKAEGKPRLPLFFWDWSTTADIQYLYFIGQIRCSDMPFIAPLTFRLRELTFTGKLNNVNANVFFGIYKTNGSLPNLGSLPQVTNQTLTYIEGDFPYPNTQRVTINLVNNGPNLPLTFSENTQTRTVTIQLATNNQGQVTTTRTQLVTAFQNVPANTITLLYAINGSGTQIVNPATFSTSGGNVGNAITSIFTRAQSYRVRYNNIMITPNDYLYVVKTNQNVASYNNPFITLYLSFEG